MTEWSPLGGYFGEDPGALAAQLEEELRQQAARQTAYQQGPLPPPPPATGQVAGAAIGQQFLPPPPPIGDLTDKREPAMISPANFPTPGQPQGAPVETGPSVPFDPALVANLVNQQGGPVTYGPRDILGEVSQSIGNGALRGAVGTASDLLGTPALNFLPGGNLANQGLNLAGVNTPSIAEAYNQDIPIISPFMRDTVQPFAGDVGSVLGTSVNQLGVGVPNLLLDQLGTSTQDVGRFLGEGATPITLGDFAVNAALAGGPLEALTGIPIDDAFRAGRSALGNYATDFLNPGMFSPEALGGREAAAVQLANGMPAGAARGPLDFPEPGIPPSIYDAVRYNANPVAPVDPNFPLPVDPNDPIALARQVEAQPPNAPNMPGGLMDMQGQPSATGISPQQPADLFPEGAFPGSRPASEGQVVRMAVQPDAVSPLDPNTLTGSRGAVELNNPSGARVLGPGEQPQPGEVLLHHGTGNAGIQGDLRPGMNLTPNEADAQSFARTASRLEGGGTPPAPAAAEAGLAPPASPPPASPSVTVGGPRTLDSLIDNTPAPSLNPSIGQLNPPGTGQQLAREAATNPALSQAQRNFLNSPNGQASADQLAGKLEQAASGGGTRPPDVPSTRSGRPGTGGTRPPSGNPITDFYHGFMDFFYGPFGMDRSDIGRQSVMRTINPFYIPDTARSIKASTRAMFDRNFAETLDKTLRDQMQANGIVPHMADWHGGSGFADRESGVSKIWNLVPGYEALNRGFAAGLNTQRYGPMLRLLDNKPTWAEGERGVQRLQHLANMNAISTGRGSFGSAAIDKALANVTGPLFTSARNAISWPERMTYLFPIQKTGTGYGLGNLDFFGPAWRTAVKDNAGYITAGLGIMAGAERLGADVDYRTGDIKVGDHHYNFWGGGYGWVKMAHDVYTGSTGGTLDSPTKLFSKAPGSKEYPPFFDTSKGNWKGSAAEFFRNKAGPGLEAIAAGLKVSGYDKKLGIDNAIDFLRPEYWDRGVTGRDLGWADRALQFVTFLNLQDIAKSVWAPGQNPGLNLETAGQAAMALPSSLGANSNTYASLTDMRRDVKDDPALPPEIRGVDPTKLGPNGLDAVNKLVEAQDPEKYKDVKEMNSRPVFEKYHETTAKIQQTVDERSTKLYDALREGRITPEQLRQGREIINSSAKAQRDEARNNPEYKKALSELEKNEVGKALDVYYKIWDSTPKLPDGKPDYDKIEARQQSFLKFADQKDAETAKLLRYEINTGKETTNPLEKLYDLAKPMLERYGNIKDDYARSLAQKNNPREDAFLALLGYGKTQSPEAAQLLQQMRQSLPNERAPVAAAAPVQRSSQPAPPAAPPPQQQVGTIGPDGRTVQQIAGTPYRSDAERAFYFESRGLPIPQAGQPQQQATLTQNAGGRAYETNAQGRTPPVTGADLAPVAQRFGINPGPFALLMNHEGNGAHDTSEKGVQPARWGIVQTTARQNGINDTTKMTPQQAYDIAGKYIATGMEQFRGDEAKAYASYYIGAGNVQKAVSQGGDWVKNADRIAGGVGNDIGVNYGGHSMTDFLQYLGLR